MWSVPGVCQRPRFVALPCAVFHAGIKGKNAVWIACAPFFDVKRGRLQQQFLVNGGVIVWSGVPEIRLFACSESVSSRGPADHLPAFGYALPVPNQPALGRQFARGNQGRAAVDPLTRVTVQVATGFLEAVVQFLSGCVFPVLRPVRVQFPAAIQGQYHGSVARWPRQRRPVCWVCLRDRPSQIGLIFSVIYQTFNNQIRRFSCPMAHS